MAEAVDVADRTDSVRDSDTDSDREQPQAKHLRQLVPALKVKSGSKQRQTGINKKWLVDNDWLLEASDGKGKCIHFHTRWRHQLDCVGLA